MAADEPVLLVLGDPHGYWRLAAAAVAAWVEAHQRWPDGILCVGDMGYFPNPEQLDKATRKHGARDPEQLEGLTRLLAPEGDPMVEALLGARPATGGVADAPPILCVAGNHESHQALLTRCMAHPLNDPLVPLDPKGRVRVIRDGAVVSVGPWRVAGLWGIQPGPNRKKPRVPGKHLDPAAIARLQTAPFDLLLTHEAPRNDALPVTWASGEGPGGTGALGGTNGSPELRALIERRGRVLQLFGHYHFAQGHRFAVGQAAAAQLAILRARTAAGAAAIRGGPGAWSVTWVSEDPAWAAAYADLQAHLPTAVLTDRGTVRDADRDADRETAPAPRAADRGDVG